ncbi:MAG: rod-binding protein [Gemmatimonadetes bacterium]|nr:rod-binding protein [Gemmatimonadota bacterium]
MIGSVAAAGTRPAPSSDDARLRRACADMEGVFLAQLFAQLRQTVPHDGIVDGGTGEEIFSSMMDENVAAAAARQQTRGLGVALYHQLRKALPAEAAAPRAEPPAAATPQAASAPEAS